MRRAAVFLVLALVASTLPLTIGSALAQTSGPVLVISQVYGGGGNTGAQYTHDYVELFNRGDQPASLNGLSIQYASATGTGNFGASATQLTELPNVMVQPGQYFLVQQAAGAGNGDPLPTPDHIDLTPIAMAAGAGKVALATGTSSLGCNGSAGQPCSAEQLERFVDLVGYGNANFFEGTGAAPTLTNTTAAFRADGGCTDTDDNAADFTSAAPGPRNSAAPANLCVPLAPVLVISQIYGAGGNAGATLTHDYVELFNRGTAPADLDGLSIQYASATGAGNFGATATQLTELPSVSIPPGSYYLVQQAGGANGAPLPTPDLIDPTPIAMAAGAGKVALVTGTTSLGCNGSAGQPCDADQLARIVDLIGYGNANFFEGSGAAPTLSATTAAFRADGGCTDTNDNAADFSAGPPAPRNSATPQHTCGDDPDDPDPPVEVCDVEEDDLTPINEIQGDGAATPMPGQAVVTRGVVTADFTSGGASGIPANQGLRGFFMEAIEADRDDDLQTSEGIFVFDGGGVFDGDIGDLVTVSGTAGEFSDVTQITATDLDFCDTTGIDTTLPPPADLPLPMAPSARTTTFEPLESMRVTHSELTVTEFFQVERFGEIRLSAAGVLQTPTNVHLPGSPEAIALAAHNRAANIILDDGRTGQNLNRLDSPDLLPYVRAGGTLRIGDQLKDHPAVLHFGFGEWRLQPIDIDAITAELEANRTRPRPETPPSVGGNFKVASFNVLNYFDGDGQGGGFPTARGATTPSELARQTEKLVDAITRLDADVYGLIEIENDGGEFQATRTLVDELNAVAGPDTYRFVDTGVIGTDAIKQAFIYKTATTRPTGEWAILTSEVDPRFDDSRSRPALAQTFTRLGTGERVTVVVNHFKSKSQSGLTDTSNPDFDQGDGQGFWNHTRTRSAEALADWLATNPTGVQSLGPLIIGDLNAYGREDPIRALEAAGYEDQVIRLTDGIPYSYTFDGMQGTLDTALALPPLAARVTGATEWHINADEVPAIDYQESVGFPGNQRFRTPEIAEAYYDPSAFRSSDHDPVLIGLNLGRSQFPGPRDGN